MFTLNNRDVTVNTDPDEFRPFLDVVLHQAFNMMRGQYQTTTARMKEETQKEVDNAIARNVVESKWAQLMERGYVLLKQMSITPGETHVALTVKGGVMPPLEVGKAAGSDRSQMFADEFHVMKAGTLSNAVNTATMTRSNINLQEHQLTKHLNPSLYQLFDEENIKEEYHTDDSKDKKRASQRYAQGITLESAGSLAEQRKVFEYFSPRDETETRTQDDIHRMLMRTKEEKMKTMETIVKLACRCLISSTGDNLMPVFIMRSNWDSTFTYDVGHTQADWIVPHKKIYNIYGNKMELGLSGRQWEIKKDDSIYIRTQDGPKNSIEVPDISDDNLLEQFIEECTWTTSVELGSGNPRYPSTVYQEKDIQFEVNGDVVTVSMQHQLPHNDNNIKGFFWLSDILHKSEADDTYIVCGYGTETSVNDVVEIKADNFNIDDSDKKSINVNGFPPLSPYDYVIAKIDTVVVTNAGKIDTERILAKLKDSRPDVKVVLLPTGNTVRLYYKKKEKKPVKLKSGDYNYVDTPTITQTLFSLKEVSVVETAHVLQQYSSVLAENKKFETLVWDHVKKILTDSRAFDRVYTLKIAGDQDMSSSRDMIDLHSDNDTWIIGNQPTEFTEALDLVLMFLKY